MTRVARERENGRLRRPHREAVIISPPALQILFLKRSIFDFPKQDDESSEEKGERTSSTSSPLRGHIFLKQENKVDVLQQR